MIPAGPEATAVRDQLERILASPLFARNERLSRFLRFVVEKRLAGGDGELKETVLATEVFARRPNYNPKQDAIVRTEAGRLRSRLSEYYLDGGKDDPLIIELPKGGYVPHFRVAGYPPADPLAAKRPRRRRVWVAAAAAVLGLSAAGWWMAQRKAPVTIAVLPLANLNQDPAYDYLADGLTDELIRTLSSFDGLAPRSRTSSFALKGKPRNVRQAGRELDAEYIVEGSILRSGERLRIDTQLVRTRDDRPVWAAKFDREAGDVIGVQEEIARAIVNSLRIKLGQGRPRYQTNPEAYDLYLHARALDFRQSVEPFREAIAKDPEFAPAYAGLAATYAYRTSTVYFDREDELIRMRALASKAVELDPLSAEAQDALGMSYARDGLWAQAEKAFRRALELAPNRSETYGNFGMCVLIPLGRFEEAVKRMWVAERGDPLSADARLHLTWVLFAARRFPEAERECGQLAEPFRSECFGRVKLGQGNPAVAATLLAAEVARGVAPGAQIRGYLAFAFARSGRPAEAEKIAAADAANPFHQVLAYVGLGDRERAMAALQRMAPQGPIRVGIALSCPELEILRGDGRIRTLRKDVGLPD